MVDLDLDKLTERIIGCAIEVHRCLGPGLPEAVYETALCIELKAAQLQFVRQVGVPLFYKGELIAEHRPDLIVENRGCGGQERRTISRAPHIPDAYVFARDAPYRRFATQFQ